MAVKRQLKGSDGVAFMAKMCIDQMGNVSRIDVLQGIPGADEAILSVLRWWKYEPDPIPICFLARFVFPTD